MSGVVHHVSTFAEARALVDAAPSFALSHCGCRERKGGCDRSKTMVCLQFGDREATGSGRHPIAREEALAHLDYARKQLLIPRPFKDEATRTVVEGICFCCDDCCSYFVEGEACDQGALVERTDLDRCNGCGACEPVCHFGARAMGSDGLELDRDACFGCGLCLEVCPEGCIEMVAR